MRRPQFSKSGGPAPRPGPALESGAWPTRTEDLETLLARIPDRGDPVALLARVHPVRRALRPLHDRVRAPALSTSSGSTATCARRRLVRRSWCPRGASRRAPRSRVRWFFRKLEAEGYLDVEGEGAAAVYRARGPLPPGDPDRAEARARAIDPRSMPAFAVVRTMVEHVAEFLRGEKTGEEILFAPAKSFLSGSTTSRTTTCSTRSTTASAPRPSRAFCRRRAGPSSSRSAAAPGSAALAVAERLARDGALPRIERYRVHRDRPDVSPAGRARDAGALSRPPGRVPPAGHGPRLREPGRRRPGSPTSSTPSTPCTSPATSPRRWPAFARRSSPAASRSSRSASAPSPASRSTSSSSSTSWRTSRASRRIRRRARTTAS